MTRSFSTLQPRLSNIEQNSMSCARLEPGMSQWVVKDLTARCATRAHISERQFPGVTRGSPPAFKKVGKPRVKPGVWRPEMWAQVNCSLILSKFWIFDLEWDPAVSHQIDMCCKMFCYFLAKFCQIRQRNFAKKIYQFRKINKEFFVAKFREISYREISNPTLSDHTEFIKYMVVVSQSLFPKCLNVYFNMLWRMFIVCTPKFSPLALKIYKHIIYFIFNNI
jgi:hypothetical protein